MEDDDLDADILRFANIVNPLALLSGQLTLPAPPPVAPPTSSTPSILALPILVSPDPFPPILAPPILVSPDPFPPILAPPILVSLDPVPPISTPPILVSPDPVPPTPPITATPLPSPPIRAVLLPTPPLLVSPNPASPRAPAPAPGVGEEVFNLSGPMQGVWATTTIGYLEIIHMLRETVLDPTSPPIEVVKYLLCLEMVYKEQKNLPFLLQRVYTPPSAVSAILMRIDMNISYLDMCTAQEFRGTMYADLDVPSHLDRIDQLSKLTIQAGNMAKLFLSYGTDQQPRLQNPVPDEVERELKPQQKLLNFLLQRAGDQRLRRKNSAFYRPRLLLDNTPTGFYEYDREIQDFIFQSVSPARLHTDFYDALTDKPSTPPQMVQLLSGLPDARCPFLEKDRTLFSFANGIFNAYDGSFQTYAQRTHTPKSTSNFFDRVLTPDILSMDPWEIPTPHFEKILLDQDLDPGARRWMYGLCGRLLHNVGSLDDWQVTLYIRGVAGSGKSSILKVMGMMYEAGDVGYMMSDGQATFCDEHLYDKHIVMAMDLDKETTFSATRVNSMTSGEKVSINRKFKTALNEEWKPPMIMASNAQPPWPDVAGNLMRRFVIFLFNYPVRVSDPNLFSKLKQEIPFLLVKMARLYLDVFRTHGHDSLWADGVLPSMCHDAKRAYLITSNALAAFLASDQVVFQPHTEIETSEFRRALMQYTKDHGDRRAPAIGMINRVDHQHLFQMYGCMLVDRSTSTGTVRTVIQGMSILDL